MKPAEIIQLLGSSEFLTGMPQEELQKISTVCRSVEYDSGAYIFHQGDYGEDLYIIADGDVFIERAMDIGKHKGHVVIDALGRGRTLGCWSTLLGQPHKLMSSANCQTPTRLLVLNGPRLRELMLESPHFGFHLLERLCFLLQHRIQSAYGAMEKI